MQERQVIKPWNTCFNTYRSLFHRIQIGTGNNGFRRFYRIYVIYLFKGKILNSSTFVIKAYFSCQNFAWKKTKFWWFSHIRSKWASQVLNADQQPPIAQHFTSLYQVRPNNTTSKQHEQDPKSLMHITIIICFAMSNSPSRL